MSPKSLFTLALLVVSSACTGATERRHTSERALETDEPPRRIVSLIPSATETIVALGAADRLVARSEFDLDSSLAHLPSIGQGLTPSLEQLALLEPDLVIAWPDNPSRSVIGRLSELGVEIYAPAVQSLDDLRRVTHELGTRLELETAADSLIAHIDAELGRIRSAVAELDRPTVFYIVWYEPATTTGSGTYIDELIQFAGGRNVFADAPGLWPQVSLEEVVRRQPDIVLLSQTEEISIEIERLSSAVGWRELEAVKQGRIIQVDANLYNRPGPRVAEATRQLALLLHPEAFQHR